MDAHITFQDGTKSVSRSIDIDLAYYYEKVFEKKASPIIDVSHGVMTKISSIYIEAYEDERGNPRRTAHIKVEKSVPGAKPRVRIRRRGTV